MRKAVICVPLRTPIGRFGGALASKSAAALGADLLAAMLERTGVPPGEVDEVILGNCYPSMDAPAIGRVVAAMLGCLSR